MPLVIEKDSDGFYVAEGPVFEGCDSQRATIDEAVKNIREVISLILEEKDEQKILKDYSPQEISLHTISV